MELPTGECKKKFETYLLNINLPVSYAFNYFTVSMKYGVYKQFFSENDIFISVKSYLTFDEETRHACFLNGNANGFIHEDINNSYKQIIKIANKEYNDKNN